MATDLDKLLVQLSADIKGYENAMKRAAGVMNKQAREIENRWRRANTNMDAISRRMASSMVAPLAGVGAALTTRQIMSYADAWTRAGNLIAAAGQVAGRAGRSLEGINQIANDTRGGFAETAELYARLLRSTAGVAQSEGEVAQATETVNKAFKAGGAAASEMAAGVLQLSQGLGSGVLQGDELRSVRENAPLLAQAIADYFGTTVAGLKKLGEEGQLTSEKVFKAILAAKGKIDSAFNATAQTIGDAVTKVNNAFTQYIGQSDESLGATGRLTAALNALADNFDKVADVTLKVAGIIAAGLLGRAILPMIRDLGIGAKTLGTFAAALRSAASISGVATAIGGIGAAAGPVGLLIGGTVATALALYYSNTKEATAGSKEYAAALKQVEEAARKTGPAVEDIAATAAKAAKEVDEEFAAAFKRVADQAQAALDPAERATQAFIDIWRGSDDAAEAQLAKIKSLISQVAQGKAPLDDLKRAIEEIGRLNGFAKIANELRALIANAGDATLSVRELQQQLKLNQLQKEFAPFNAEAEAEERQKKLRADGEAYLKDARERNSLTKEQLRLEEEIAKIRKDPRSAGLSDTEVKGLARENIAAADRRSAEGRKAPRTAESRFEQDIQSVRDRTAALVEEQRIVGLSVAQQESRRMAMDLEQQALKNLREEARRNNDENWRNVELSQEQKDAIAQVSAAYGEQAAALERVREAHQRAEQLASEFYDTFKSGIVDAITGAKSLDEALQGVLKRLGDLLINAAFDSLFKPPGSGAGGLLGSLLGIGRSSGGGMWGGITSPGGWWAEGGYTGAGGKYQPAGVVHKGEVVWSQKDVARAGGVSVVEAMRRGARGYADGGAVVPRFEAPTLPRVAAPAGGGAVSVSVPINIDARGADREGLLRVEAQVARLRAELPTQVVATVRDAQKRRAL